MLPAALQAAADRAAAVSPMPVAGLPPIPGRVLLVDGDAAAYSCAGRDDTDPGEAKVYLQEKIAGAQRVARAERTIILLTGRASHKGHRYAVATVKPYQGSRSSSRRPKNWEYLRTLMEDRRVPHKVMSTETAEADDLFGRLSTTFGWQSTVLYTEDKDMRMVPGIHLNWNTHALVEVPPEAWAIDFDDKVYGRKWFWLQMLQGDPADTVPGLPGYFNEKGKAKPVGPKTAEQFLANAADEAGAAAVVFNLYRDYYHGAAALHMLEQGVLLWMRRDPGSHYLDVTQPGNPLHALAQANPEAVAEIVERVESVPCSSS